MKQIGLALTQYAQDYDEIYPMAWNRETGANFASWDLIVGPYTGSKGGWSAGTPMIFKCPSDSLVPRPGGGNPRSYAMAAATEGRITPTSSTPGGEGNMGLGFAGKAVIGATGKMYSEGRKVAEVPAPASTLMVAEVLGLGRLDYAVDAVVARPFSQPGCSSAGGITDSGECGQDHAMPQTALAGNHLEGWNYLFADGHVKWLRPVATLGTSVTANNYRVYCDSFTKPAANMKGMWTLDPTD